VERISAAIFVEPVFGGGKIIHSLDSAMTLKESIDSECRVDLRQPRGVLTVLTKLSLSPIQAEASNTNQYDKSNDSDQRGVVLCYGAVRIQCGHGRQRMNKHTVPGFLVLFFILIKDAVISAWLISATQEQAHVVFGQDQIQRRHFQYKGVLLNGPGPPALRHVGAECPSPHLQGLSGRGRG
jgi:hypothetical protein